MITLAITIGLYSYVIFILGILKVLYVESIVRVTILTIIVYLLLNRKSFKLHNVFHFKQLFLQKELLFILVFSLLIFQAFINVILALAPELSFDALWYHLTLPKLYLQNHSLTYIPGGLFYYSTMPQLGEMLYTATLALGSEITAKIVHYMFGVLTLIVIYLIARKLVNPLYSLIACVVFYSNLVVSWQSGVAYIDLARTFYESMAILMFVMFIKAQKKKWLFLCAIMVGFSISTKLLSLGSLPLYITLLSFVYYKSKSIKSLIFDSSLFLLIALLVPLPWFVFSYVNTINPIFPFFTPLYPVPFSINLLNPFNFVKDMWNLLLYSEDPLSPIYLIVLPLLFYRYTYLSKQLKILVLYCLLSLLIWYITPRTGGGRFILPYLPAFSIVVVGVLVAMKDKFFYRTLLVTIIFIALITIIYRGVANSRYIPVILGFESKDTFLSRELNFSFGDFYDVDGYLSKTIQANKVVLIVGGHNLYYVPFRFIHTSFRQENDVFTYVLTIDSKLPEEFKHWKMIHYTRKTKAILYKKP